MPALVALVVGADGRPSGVQRIFLTEDGRKADLRGGKVKFSLGRVGGGAVRIAPPDGELILCEGIEDALSAVELFGQAAWATCGTSNLGSVDLPPEVRSVIIGADADEAGMAAARKAAARYAAQGLTARILKPLDGHKDFNSEINQGAR
jgi:DNA primase